MLKAVEIKKIKTLETEAHWKADLSIKFYYFEPPDQDRLGRPTNTELSLLQKLEDEVKKAVDKRFGTGTVKITSQIRRHSLEIIISVVGLVGTLVALFSNYEKFKKGVEAFLGDLQKIAYRLHRIVRKYLGQPRKRMFDNGLILPSIYHYGSIREKLPTEKAVEELMDLMARWSGGLVSLADSHDSISEVTAYEIEHAMKNAVDMLLYILNAEEAFHDFTEEEKFQQFMCLYPDMALLFLKKKIFLSEDNEKLDDIMSDKRNDPFFECLESWLRASPIFENMRKSHSKKVEEDVENTKESEKIDGGVNGEK